MLPIAKRHRLVIPHRLALTAAAVCLILSFTAGRSDPDGQLQAEHGSHMERIETIDSSAEAIRQHEAGSSTRRSGRLRLLPWFSGLMRW